MTRCLEMPTSAKPTSFSVQTPASLGIAIRHFRTQAQLSQAELATRAGIHRSYLSALERGHGTEYLQRVFRLLKQIDVKMVLEKAG
jgi:transcriptional regulator with XRE-family HTH domain